MPNRNRKMVLLAVVLICTIGVLGCGGSAGGADTDHASSSPQTSSTSTGVAAYGHPANGDLAARTTEALRGYFAALGRGEGRAACSYLAAPELSQVAALSSRVQGAPRSCGAELSSMAAGGSPGGPGRLEVNAVRVANGQGFAIYRGPGGRREFMPLLLEGGEPKLAALGGSALP